MQINVYEHKSDTKIYEQYFILKLNFKFNLSIVEYADICCSIMQPYIFIYLSNYDCIASNKTISILEAIKYLKS